jgi:hypothetical protein
MPREDVTAFVRRVAEDGLLRAELALLAGRYGFRFTADELATVGLTTRTVIDPSPADDADEQDDEPGDPGFGIIEVPA